jgi:hypothetical protein
MTGGRPDRISPVDKGPQQRAARTEALFRETNEAIERGLWPGDQQDAVRFRCECAHLDCHTIIRLTLPEYEHVRENPRRFVIAFGHEVPEAETVVERRDDYLVVEKRGESGAEAERLDPRS